jgi:hypothetical protein
MIGRESNTEKDVSRLITQAREQLGGGALKGYDWLLGLLNKSRKGGVPAAWMLEQPVSLVESALNEAGEHERASVICERFAAIEAEDLRQRHETSANALDAIATLVDAIAREPPPTAIGRSSGSVKDLGSIVLRPVRAEDEPALWELLTPALSGGSPAGDSRSIFLSECTPAADVVRWLATDQDGAILAISAIMQGADNLTEVAPPVVRPRQGLAQVAELLTAVQCVHHSFLDPDRQRRYWSAVPLGLDLSQAVLRDCGFRADAGVWRLASGRLAQPAEPEQTSWLSASAAELCNYVLRQHSRFARLELPAVDMLLPDIVQEVCNQINI